ncbi:uncharacterized protein [Halyomorpha halys]|uniref:uncharacterized protein isoform X2 n=1 Tax=Halyomorpha halys TaxID=286706 RepID=UPI0006D51839|nr:uncharacterized protein LOC112209996 isoform X2 [Halyomorpha halys]
MQLKSYQIIFLMLYQLDGIGHCLGRLGEESDASEKTVAQESSSWAGLEDASKIKHIKIKTDRNKNHEKKRDKGVFTQTNNFFKNMGFYDIFYDLFGEFIPIKSIKRHAKPKTFKKKNNDMTGSSEAILAIEEVSYIDFKTSPTKLKLKTRSALNNTGKKTDSEEKPFAPDSLLEEHEIFDSKTEKKTIEKVFVDNVTIHENICFEKENGNAMLDLNSKKDESSTCFQDAGCRPKYLNEDANLEFENKCFIHESSKTHEGINTGNAIEEVAASPYDVEGPKNQEMFVQNEVSRNEEGITCSENVCTRPKYLNRDPKLDDQKRGFIHESSTITNKVFDTENIIGEAAGLNHMERPQNQEMFVQNKVSRNEEDITCSENVCTRPKYLIRDPKLDDQKRGFIHESSTTTNKVFATENVIGVAAGLNDVFMSEGSRNEKGMTCSDNVCKRQSYSKLQENIAEVRQLKKGSEEREEEPFQIENNMKELADNIEGIRYILLDRQQQMKREPTTNHELLKNISTLIKKMELLQAKIEQLNVTCLENSILTPDEEALITGLEWKLNEFNSKHEQWQTEDRYKFMNDEKKKYLFSSALGQCVLCITVANKFHEAFSAIFHTADFKDIPPAHLNLGDDWCDNFSRRPLSISNEILRNWPNLFNREELDIQFQKDLANDLYRFLISDIQLYRHWRRNNNDMIKTLCTSDYTIEFKSCTPFL